MDVSHSTLCAKFITAIITMSLSLSIAMIHRRGRNFLSLSISWKRRRLSSVASIQILRHLFNCKSLKTIGNAMMSSSFAGAKIKWNYNREIYRVEKQKAQVCRLSLFNTFVRCEDKNDNHILASYEITCNFFVGRYV